MGCVEELSVPIAIVAELDPSVVAWTELVETMIFSPSSTATPLGVSVCPFALGRCVELSVTAVVLAVVATGVSVPEF